ncbi:hypothetical protein NP493_127g04047 [Ridgeia piscesae]|uniref:DUF885 domain-containing protein n=1 Tax=Ridgeia piscesae TaxID=27915 RepID=A0AAD9P5P2_RIDPI|nr:hypothetical protein NP493_127g04047 [Ridgeia piscesae]
MDWRFRDDPYCAWRFGQLRKYNRLQEDSETSFLRRVTFASDLLSKARQIDRRDFTKEDRLNVAILTDQLETYIDGYPFRMFGAYNPYSPWMTPFIKWKAIVLGIKIHSASDANLVFQAYKDIARQIDQQMALMNESIHLGTTNTEESMKGVLSTFDNEIETLRRHPFYTPFVRPFMNIPRNTPNRTRLRLIAEEKCREILLPAFVQMRHFLATVYLQNTRPRVGLSSLPNGTAYYRASLRWHLSLNITPEEVHQLGLSEVTRVLEKIQQLIRPYRKDGDLHAYMAEIRSRRENYYKTYDGMIHSLESIIAKTHTKLPQLLRNVPKLPVIVKPFSKDNILTAGYARPSWDGSKPGIFYVNPSSLTTTPKFQFIPMILHEAEPGHHTQMAHVIESNVAKFRKVITCRVQHAVPFSMPDYTAYCEGWGLYAESLGEEINAYTEPNDLLGRYTAEIFRASRLVVDTGIHAFGWSRERAVDYMTNHTTLDRETIEREVSRYIIVPGQACAYKIGEMKIRELRTKAENILGPRFDKRDFHEAILKTGEVPLYLLDSTINDWIMDKMASPVVSGASRAMSLIPCVVITVWLVVSGV